MTGQGLASLDALVGELERLLAALDAGGEGASGAWARCSEAFERCRGQLEGAPLGPRERQRAQDALRLQAVAASCLRRMGEELGLELQQVRGSRERLRGALRDEGQADACNVRG